MSKTLVIKPGESGILDKSKTILGIYYTGNSFAQSGCTLPAPGQMACFALRWAASDNNGGTHALDFSDPNVWLKKLIVGGVEYLLPTGSGKIGIRDEQTLVSWIQVNIPAGLINVETHSETTVGQRYEMVIGFKSPENLGSGIALVINAPGFGGESGTTEVLEYAVTCSDCCPSDSL